MKALKRWKLLAAGWPCACIAIAVLIAAQPGRTLDERISGIGFALMSLVFFAVGMSIRLRVLRERQNATVRTEATVVSQGRRSRVGRRCFFPEYAFQAEGRTYRVTSRAGYGVCHVSEGRTVALYYAPEDPRIFYVPLMQRRDLWLSNLFCSIGLLWPLLGLFMPWIQGLLPL